MKSAYALNSSRTDPVPAQTALPVVYKSVNMDCGFRADLIVEEVTIVELKTVERIMPVHEAQLLTF